MKVCLGSCDGSAMEGRAKASIALGTLVCVLAAAIIGTLFCRGRRTRGARIPPGSRGWPLIGETLHFANANPVDFVGPRVKKYGPVFSTHLMGVPSVVVTKLEMARFVYAERALFRASYPSTIATLVGRKSLSNCDPARHPFLKKVVLGSLLPDTLRRNVHRVEGHVLEHLSDWNDRTVQTAAEMKEFTLSAAVYFVFGVADVRQTPEAQILVETYKALAKAFYALPVNLPGFTWYKAMKSKETSCKYLQRLIAQSRQDSKAGRPCYSVLRALVDARDPSGEQVGDQEIIDVLIGTFFGALDTTATTLTWVIKFLTENPEVLESVKAEQNEIASLKRPGQPLAWEDTRKMRYSHQVIQETLRYPTVLQFTGRAAMQDVVYEGFLIPKGWRVFVMTTCIHLDPANHPAPTTFDPSRFKVAPKPGTYLPFAGGAHMCPGNELAKLVILVFLHHFTTKFRWESVLPEMGTEFKPFPMPKGGYPIRVYCEENQDDATGTKLPETID